MREYYLFVLSRPRYTVKILGFERRYTNLCLCFLAYGILSLNYEHKNEDT